jgi:hypothetical protein
MFLSHSTSFLFLRFLLMGLLLYIIWFFSQSSIFFHVLCANCFNYNMPWKVSILVMSVWCPGDFLYLNVHILKIWEIFCYHFVEYTTYTFGFLLWCPSFTGLVFLWSWIFLAYSFHSSWIFCLRNLLFFSLISILSSNPKTVFYLFHSPGVAFNCVFCLT